MTVRVLIADDEAPARRMVRTYLSRRADVEVVAEAENGLEVVDGVRSLDPAIVVLDVQMPGMNAFEAIQAIGHDRVPPIVFATAFDEFAIRAFEVNAVDYLLKPFSQERFDSAFDRALARGSAASQHVARMVASMSKARWLERVVVRKADRLFFVPVSEILHLAAEGNYVRVHTASESHLIRGTLSDLEDRLDPKRFARIHRSGIVNIDAIAELRPHFHGDYVVLLKGGEKLRLSRRYQEQLLGRE
jgi:two-component system LytT family response regulator